MFSWMASTVFKCCLKKSCYRIRDPFGISGQRKQGVIRGEKKFYKKKKSAFDLEEQNNENPRFIKTRGLQATLEKTNKYRGKFRMIKNWKGKTMEVLKSSFRVNKTGSWIDFLDRNWTLKQNRSKLILLQKGRPLPGPESKVLSNTWEWVVQGDTCADKARNFIGEGATVESSRAREPGRTAMPRGLQSWFYGNWVSFWLVLWSVILTQIPSWWCVHHSAKVVSGEKDSGRWVRHMGWHLLSSFWPFLSSSGWW